MRRRSLMFTTVVTALYVWMASGTAHANQCAMSALREAKAAGNNTTELKKVYDKYLGEPAARWPVRRVWSKMDESARTEQIKHARSVTVTLAKFLAGYADAKIVWHGKNTGTYFLGGASGVFTVTMAGKGCLMSDVCTPAGCLSKYIGDLKRLRRNSPKAGPGTS